MITAIAFAITALIAFAVGVYAGIYFAAHAIAKGKIPGVKVNG